jgi:preprotein translocase subunit SecA
MSLFTKTLNKIFKTGNQKELDKVKPLVAKINAQEPNFQSLKDEELKAKKRISKMADLLIRLFLKVLL